MLARVAFVPRWNRFGRIEKNARVLPARSLLHRPTPAHRERPAANFPPAKARNNIKLAEKSQDGPFSRRDRAAFARAASLLRWPANRVHRPIRRVPTPPAEPNMSAVYKNLGVEFAYPENWQITDEQAQDWPRGVSLETPNGGFWWLQLHPPTNPRDLAAEVLNTMRLEYAELEAEPVTELIGETEVVGFDMHFYCLDLLVTAQARSLQLGKFTLLILSQAEDREFERLEPVFHAMLVSLLRNQARAES